MPVLTPTGTIQRWDAATIAWNTIFRENLADTPTFWQLFASELPSSTREEDHLWMDRLPQMREFNEDRHVVSPSVRLQKITNKTYELTVGVKREEIEDDQLGVYAPIVREAARQAKVLPDVLTSAAIVAGTSATVYDGVYYFSASHPVNPDDTAMPISSANSDTTQANLMTSTASGNYPGALAFSTESIEKASEYMAGLVGPDQLPMNVIPNAVMVPPQLKWKAAAALHAEIIGRDITLTTQTNMYPHAAAAQTNVLKGSLELIVNPYLASDATTWYLLCTDRAVKPFVWQNRLAPEFAILTKPEDQNVFMHNEFRWGVRSRGAAGYAQWFMACCCKAT